MPKALLLIFLASSFPLLQAQYTIDGILSQFRTNYFSYKLDSIKNINTLFLNNYAVLNSTLYRLMDPYLKPNNSWSVACSNFKMSKLKSSTASRLSLACEVVNSVFPLAYPAVNAALMSFYGGLLGSPIIPQRMAEDIFETVEDHMCSIVPAYNRQPACVGALLVNYGPIFRPSIDAISATLRKVADNTYNLFYNATNAGRIASTTFTNLASSLNYCNAIQQDPTSCVQNLVR